MDKNSLVKVSVCVSFYNAERFVFRCLDMLCAQTMKEGLEIVLVNDGSKDNTDELMRSYASNHPERKFVLITQDNGSLCQGRKTGIANASGEYIAFFDQDDLIDETAYDKLYNCAKSNDVDIVEMQSKYGDVILAAPFDGLHSSHEVLLHYFSKGGIQSQLWMRIYRRTLFSKPVLPSIRTNNEDMFGFPCLLHAAKTIYFYPEVLHTYTIDENSYMGSMSNPKMAEKKFQSCKIALGAFEHFKEYVGKEEMEDYSLEFTQYQARYIFVFLMSKFFAKSMKDKIQAVTDETDLKSLSKINKFLKTNFKNNWFIYKIYRLFGLNFSSFLYGIKHHSI